MCWLRLTVTFLGIFTLATAATAAAAARATPAPLYAFTEEDDGIFSHQDRHYTQGFRLTRTVTTTPGTFWDGLGGGFERVAGWLGAGTPTSRRYVWPIVGQSLFTPTNIKIATPDPHDRPYAGWLYVGAGLTQRDASGRTDHLQVLLGVVGPAAGGSLVQDIFHSLAGYGKAEGWSHQLRNEPALLVGYRVNWDVPLGTLGPLSADVLPSVGVVAGNVLTYGAGGLTLRIGQSLAAGDTPRTITPGLSGTGWFDPSLIEGRFGWMLYVGAQGRAVWRNLFLQGNSWHDSPSVPMKHFVSDKDVGVAFLFKFGLRVDISYIDRSHEFFGQQNNDRIGSVTLSAPL